MKRISHKLLTALLMMLPLMWQSCAEEDFRVDGPNADFQGIAVSIPYVEDGAELSASTRSALTRAGQTADFVGEEATINNLYIFAFPNGKTGEKKAVSLDKGQIDAPSASKVHSGYKCCNMQLEVGEYHIYLLANVALSNYKNMTEDEVKNYKFATVAGAISEFTGGLPMSCGASEIVSDGAKTGNYVVVESEKATHVQANLRFAVAKVRVSVINNITDNYSLTKAEIQEMADMLYAFGDNGMVDPTVSAKTKDVLSLGKYFALPAVVNGKYPTDNLGSEIADHSGKWVWQIDFYVPERTTENTTALDLAFSSKSTKKFHLGLQENDKSTLKRSNYYRYTLMPASGSITLQVQGWTLDAIQATLGGPVTLEVDKTDVGTVSGKQTQYLKYSSNVTPVFESPKVDGKDLFILTPEAKEDGTYVKVAVNPALGIISDSNKLKDLDYFYVVAGPIKKRITANPDLGPYLTVTPANYTVVMKEIANEVEYSIEYTYSTNLESLKYAFGTSCVNNPGNDLKYYMASDISTEVRPGSTANLGQEGRIIVKFVEPYNPAKFQLQSDLEYVFTASGSNTTLKETVTLNIVPNLNGYRLWFRDINDSWTNPHVYVYQPLDYNHNGTIIPVKTWKDANTKDNTYQDGLLYSFTGGRYFKGWSNVTGIPSPQDDKLEWQQLYSIGDDYYYSVNFMEDYRKNAGALSSCDKCNNNNTSNGWPGIAMKKITDSNSPQYNWWYVDLPAICAPGKALIMFTNAHEGKGEDMSKDQRFPAHLVPGIPLYDYPDREGWFLYDKDIDNRNEFVDDQPGIGNNPIPNPDPDPDSSPYYIIRWQTNWLRKACHVWNDSGDFNSWGNDAENSVESGGWQYFVIDSRSKAGDFFNVIFYQKENDSKKTPEKKIFKNQFTSVDKPTGLPVNNSNAASVGLNSYYGSKVWMITLQKSDVDKD